MVTSTLEFELIDAVWGILDPYVIEPFDSL
jgi:hypothetical protein